MCGDDSNDEFDPVSWAGRALCQDSSGVLKVGCMDWTFRRGHVGVDVLLTKAWTKFIFCFNPYWHVRLVLAHWLAPDTIWLYRGICLKSTTPNFKAWILTKASKTRQRQNSNRSTLPLLDLYCLINKAHGYPRAYESYLVHSEEWL